MARPHAAAIVEDAWHRRVNALLRARGWKTRIVSHTGYGSESFVRGLNPRPRAVPPPVRSVCGAPTITWLRSTAVPSILT